MSLLHIAARVADTCDTCLVAGYSEITRPPYRIHMHMPLFLSSATAVLHPAGPKKTVLQPDTEGTREQTEKVREPHVAQNTKLLCKRQFRKCVQILFI